MREFIKIEIDSACNLKCDYCFRYFPHFGFKVVMPSVIKKLEFIFSKYNPWTSVFRVECLGEITLYPDLLDYLMDKCRQEGYVIEVLSNGTGPLALANQDDNLKWFFSLDGHTPEMNKHRKLNRQQVESILDTAIGTGAEIQCVFWEQTIEEMNSFIAYLQGRVYRGFLHIFPCRLHGRPLEFLLKYDELLKADFIPDEEYFRRWEKVYESGKRDFTCDFFKNGYAYRIMPDEFCRTPDEIKKMKCDCGGGGFKMLNYEDDEPSCSPGDCGSCINHFEYNNSRRIVNL